MSSIRSKLTVSYAAVMLATMLLFAVAVFWVRSASVVREAAQQAVSHADLAVGILKSTQRQNIKIVADSAAGSEQIIVSDSLVGALLNPQVSRLLAAIPGYLIVFDGNQRRLYSSAASNRLNVLDGSITQRERQQEDMLAFEDGLASARTTTRAVVANLRNDRVVLVQRGGADPLLAGRRVIAGISMREFDRSQTEILGSALLILPFVLLISVGGAYIIAGRAIHPIDRITTEVEAITDGRSLHRRLGVETSGDELARLTTTLNAMIGRLEQSFGALRRFTADASHELKTPLAVLRADVERAMHVATQSNEQLIALEEALEQTTRMADLVESLLTLARADEGRFDLHREPVLLEPLVREVMETAVILGEDAGLEVKMHVDAHVVVLGDHTRIRQLFLNLVTNAIKYTPRGGKVELDLTRYEQNAHFSVRDTGIGIAAADLPFIFERFWRADRARSRMAERGGFGLGLAISQWIAQAHGGQLTVQSRLSRGTTFTVVLPLFSVSEGSGPAPSLDGSGMAAGTSA